MNNVAMLEAMLTQSPPIRQLMINAANSRVDVHKLE